MQKKGENWKNNSQTLILNWFRQELSLDVKTPGWMANGGLGIHSMPKEHHIVSYLLTSQKVKM